MVSPQPRERSIRAAPPHPRVGPRTATVRLFAHLGVAATRRLAGEYEARASTVPPGGTAAAHARAPPQTHRAASRTSARSDRSDGALEHGLCARCVGRWSPVSGFDRGRSVESPESHPRSGLQFVGRDRGSRPGSRAPGGRRAAIDHGRSRHRIHVARSKTGRIGAACSSISFGRGNPWRMPSSNPSTGVCGTSV